MKKRNFYYISFCEGKNEGMSFRWKPSFRKKILEDFNWIELVPIFNPDSNSFSVEKDWPCWKDDDGFISFSDKISLPGFNDLYWKIGWPAVNNIMINFFNDYRDLFFNYKGKVLFVNDNDALLRTLYSKYTFIC